jgi:hypothetical protein
VERPTRAKKNYRPAQVVFDYSIQRRTSEQVKADQAKAKAEAAAAEAAAVAEKQNQLDRVAALEDAMQAQQDAHSLDDLRPDLYISQKSASSSDTLSDSHLMPDDPIGLPRVPLTDLPPERSSYRGSSHSDDFLTGWEETETEENVAVIVEENNDQDQDQGYVMPESDNESVSHGSQDQTLSQKSRRKAKFKPQVSFFILTSTLSELMHCPVSSEAISALR